MFSTLIATNKNNPVPLMILSLVKIIVYYSALHNSESEELKDIGKIAVDPECVFAEHRA